jgi:hypothetical protein
MAVPAIVLLALAGGAAYALLATKKAPAKSGGAIVPAGGGSLQTGVAPVVVTIPTDAIEVHPEDVDEENRPSVTLTVPPLTNTTNGTSIPVGVATFPPLTAETVTKVLPQLATQAAQAAQATQASTPPASVAQTVTKVLPQLVTQASQTVTATPTALQTEEIKIDQDPNGTVLLAKSLIDAESSTGWKTALKPEITRWQKQVGLVADGLFGPKSVLKMALEVGILPLIRYFPRNSTLSVELKKYRDALYTMAANADNKNPAHGAALRSSATYETGQAFGTPKAIPLAARAAQAANLAATIGGHSV